MTPFGSRLCARSGFGGAALKMGWDDVRAGTPLPVVLNTYSPRAKALYQRHGFREIGAQEAGGTVWWLVRGADGVLPADVRIA